MKGDKSDSNVFQPDVVVSVKWWKSSTHRPGDELSG
jgi:hypothetical protein